VTDKHKKAVHAILLKLNAYLQESRPRTSAIE
jgi:hypothetical protein